MLQILRASFWKFIKLSSSGLSLSWSVIDEVTTRNTTAYFFRPTVYRDFCQSVIGVTTSVRDELLCW